MARRRHKRYLRRMFEGENGDCIKNILTDGKWKPSKPYGSNYKRVDPTAVKIVSIVVLIIFMGAVVFGVWRFLAWIW